MKISKRIICIVLAIVLIAVFLFVRNTSEAGKEFTDGIISNVLGVETEAEDSSQVKDDAPADEPAAPDDTETADEYELSLEDEPVEEPDFSEEPAEVAEPAEDEASAIDEDGVYDSKDEVALYIHLYGHLPSNYITKDEAKAQGWSGSGSDKLDKYCPGMCIGGDYFGNREGLLPKASGRKYTECDIDTMGAKQRGTKRIVFSNDGLIYYTDDHYTTFTLLYGEP